MKIDFFLSTSTSRNLFLNRGVEQLKSGLLPWWGTLVGHFSKFYTGRVRLEVQPLAYLLTIF